jgi:osmoprotectant transport system permease protein
MNERRVVLDPLGAVLVAAAALALWLQPLLLLKPNRILPGAPRALLELLPAWGAAALIAALLAAALLALFWARPLPRLFAALVALAGLAAAVGEGAAALTPAGDRVIRVAPGAAFWILTLLLGLLATDALARLRQVAVARLGWLLAAVVIAGLALSSGHFDALSVMREYAAASARFGAELRRHLLLATLPLLLAVPPALALGIACQLRPRLRGAVLALLNGVQTLPAIALFGILIAPLAALAAAFPALSASGLGGIGFAPAAIALFLYSLLPLVANTLAGLARVDAAARDAALGMGMSRGQCLRAVELPLALPSMLAGFRIALVQNIGLATIAALVGGGGLGAFVFQGIGQAAIDLVLLGAIPTVLLAFGASLLLDALAGTLSRGRLA